jgi:hypothetical protein
MRVSMIGVRFSRLPWRTGLLLAVVLAFLVLGVAALNRPRVPVYEGRSLYAWIAELQRTWKQQQGSLSGEDYQKARDDWQMARQAVQTIGTNALPWLLADVTATRPSLNELVRSWLAATLPFLGVRADGVAGRWTRGISGLETLGPVAAPCLPELVVLATNNIGYGGNALVAVGPPALPAVTNLLSTSSFPRTGNLIGALANAIYTERISRDDAAMAIPALIAVCQSQDAHARRYAAGALGAIRQRPELCIPVLVERLADASSEVQRASAQALGAFGDAASEHAGTLAELYARANSNTRAAICRALSELPAAAEVAVPVLVQGAGDSSDIVRITAVTGLGQLGVQPELALPALLRSVKDRSDIVRIMAIQAIGQFGTNAGVAEPLLVTASHDTNAQVRQTAETALHRLRGEIPPR